MGKTATVVRHIPITQARANLGKIVRRARINRECFIVEKAGVPVAGIMNVDDMEDYLELQDPRVKAQIAQSQEDYRRGRVRDAREFLAELRRDTRKPNRHA